MTSQLSKRTAHLRRERHRFNMGNFREEYRFLIFYAATFGLYMKSLNKVTDNKLIIAFYTVWSKIPIVTIPLYISWDLYSFVFDKEPLILKIAMARKIIAFVGFVFKNIMFYLYRNQLEELIDLWDNSFQEEIYPKAHQDNRKRAKKYDISLVRVSLALAIFASLLYSLPSSVSKTKTLFHPSGIKYPHRSPEFEMILAFDFAAAASGVSACMFDCILVVFLSQVSSKLRFLSDSLTDMINVFIIDNEGRLLGRRPWNKSIEEMRHSRGEAVNYLDIVRNTTLEDLESFEDFQNGYYEETTQRSEEFNEKVLEFEKKLRILIKHHQQTAEFFEKLRKVYAPVATIELMYIVMYTAFTALHLVQMRPGFSALGIILVASSNLVSIFLWCKLGARVESTHLFEDAFGQSWFLFPKKIQVAFQFIIMRCKKPLTLYGLGLYHMNLGTFFEILKLTYQFFAFVGQLTNK